MKESSERGCGNSGLRKENLLSGVVKKCEDTCLESVGSQAFSKHSTRLYSVPFTGAWEEKTTKEIRPQGPNWYLSTA